MVKQKKSRPFFGRGSQPLGESLVSFYVRGLLWMIPSPFYVRNLFSNQAPTTDKKYRTFGGSLGWWIDEERSQLRQVM